METVMRGSASRLHMPSIFNFFFFQKGLTSVSVTDLTFTFLSESYLGRSPIRIRLVHLA